MIRRVLLVGVASAILTACGQARPVIAKPPVALLSCQDEPTAPDLPSRDQQDARDRMTLEYLLSLRGAWGSCHSAVAGIAAWANEMERN